MLGIREFRGKRLQPGFPFKVAKQGHLIDLDQILRQIAYLMVPRYGETSPIILRLTCNDPEQRGLSRSVVPYKSDPALGGNEPVDPVQDSIIFEIYLKFLDLYQFLLPPGS